MTAHTIRCPSCGTLAPVGTRSCLECDARLSDPGADTIVFDHTDDPMREALQEALAPEYVIERELGRGGMAVVYVATEVQLGRRVALKVLPPELALRKSMAERFKREGKMAASLDHPNIIPVYRVGLAAGLLYMVMRFVDGRGLDEIIETQGALPVVVVLHVLRSAARALAYAHERGIVHRDVKSANILVDKDGRVLVTDFGIARTIEDPQLTQTGMVVGTPYFMSPEQCAARRIGPQSDQYSLGIVAFQMLTGGVPFSAETLPGIMHHHFYTPVPDIRRARTDVPEQLLVAMDRILAKKPEHRYPSTSALVEALQSIPHPENERRSAEVLLQELAAGVPVQRVKIEGLPQLKQTVRLTPSSGIVTLADALAAHRRRVRRLAVVSVTAAVTVLGLGGGAWVWAKPRAAAPPLVLPPVVALPPIAPPPPRPVRERSAPPAATPVEVLPAPPPHGLLRVGAFPRNADIYVDGRLLGQGVVVDSALSAGSHRLRITAPGYVPFDTTFRIQSRETTQLGRIALQPTEDTP